ncbi:MAG: hypothetical protein U1F71_22625 [Verrucomicrobiaceae bacterium]
MALLGATGYTVTPESMSCSTTAWKLALDGDAEMRPCGDLIAPVLPASGALEAEVRHELADRVHDDDVVVVAGPVKTGEVGVVDVSKWVVRVAWAGRLPQPLRGVVLLQELHELGVLSDLGREPARGPVFFSEPSRGERERTVSRGRRSRILREEDFGSLSTTTACTGHGEVVHNRRRWRFERDAFPAA